MKDTLVTFILGEIVDLLRLRYLMRFYLGWKCCVYQYTINMMFFNLWIIQTMQFHWQIHKNAKKKKTASSIRSFFFNVRSLLPASTLQKSWIYPWTSLIRLPQTPLGETIVFALFFIVGSLLPTSILQKSWIYPWTSFMKQ